MIRAIAAAMKRCGHLRTAPIVGALLVCSGLLLSGLLLPAIVAPAGSEDQPTAVTVMWEGHTLREVSSLAGLPPALQGALGVGSGSIGGIADRGGNFNSTDFVNMKLPMRRFAVAGVGASDADKDIALVAVERGGIALRSEVTLYAKVESKPVATRTWSIHSTPHTLRALVDQIIENDKKPASTPTRSQQHSSK